MTTPVSDTTDATGRLPGTLSIGLHRVRIELLQFGRDREAAFFTVILPVLLLVVFGSAFSGDVARGVSFSQYFLAGMIASGIVYTSFQNLAISIPQERDVGTLKRLLGTPMPKASYFIGKIGLILVIYIGQVVLMSAIGVVLFDVHLPSDPADWWTFTWVSALGLVCCTLLGIAFSAVARSGRGAPALVSPVVLVLQFTSGVFFQYDELPPWMQQLAALFPLKWLCQGMRSVFLPDSFQRQELAGSWELGRTALVLALWSVAALVLALRYFRWQHRDDT
ncbi:MAG: type transport system permease protein [Actinomycetota bacterium]|nr:type transport system permease protein [Actinomycetota bacterium]